MIGALNLIHANFIMRKYLSYIVLASASVCFMPIAVAQNNTAELPVVELLGDSYYMYTAKKGESLFGVARRFGWDDKKLIELNPSVESPLKKGVKIYYPVAAADKKTASNVKKEAAGLSELRHTVQRGETVYGIASMYAVPVETIYALNPASRNGIKTGESLLIRNGDEAKSTSNSKAPIFYTIKEGDTLYRLGQDYGVSVAAIMTANPGINENNFKTGTNIKIPVKGTGLVSSVETFTESSVSAIELKQVGKKETWNSISSQTGVPVEVLKEANPGILEPKNKDYISIPKVETVTEQREVVAIDPREQSSEGVSAIYEDVHGIAAADSMFTVRVAVVASNPSSNKDAEYLRGFLTGIDRLKRDDYHIDFKVVDGTGDEAGVVSQLEKFDPTIVFLTADNDIPVAFSEYAMNSHTPLVNVFDTRNSSYTENPYMVQLLTPSNLFNDNVAKYIEDNYAGYTIIFAGDYDDKDMLADALRRVWDKDRIRTATIDEIVPGSFRENGKYLIYSYPVKKSEVQRLMGKVTEVRREKPLADIATLGRPNLIVFEDEMAQDFHNANVSVPSRFYIDKESSAYRTFLSSYRLLFDRTPVKSLPLYAATGYDTASYFISALKEARADINLLKPSRGTVQNDFELWRTSNWSGFLNPPVFMVDFTPYGTIDKNVISYGE